MQASYCRCLLIFYVIAARIHSVILCLCLEVIQELQLFYRSLINGDYTRLKRGIFRIWILSLGSVTIKICYWLMLKMRKYKSIHVVNTLQRCNRNRGNIKYFIDLKRAHLLIHLLYFIIDLCSLLTMDLWWSTDCFLFL